MADEAVLKVETDLPINFTCASGTTIEKGAICMMSDVMTAATSTGDTDIVAGIAQSEKLAAETSQTSIAIYRGGIFRGTAGVAGVVFGEPLVTDSTTSGANRLVKAAINAENIVGVCLETAATGDTFLFELNPFAATLA